MPTSCILLTPTAIDGINLNPDWGQSTVVSTETIAGNDVLKYDNLKDFASDVAKQHLEFEPGSKYLYGINMAILGRVAEVVSNKNFYEFLKHF